MSIMNDVPLSESILDLANRAEESLVRVNTLVKSKVKRVKEPEQICYWALFLENPPTATIETCAVSIGATSLLMSGEGIESDVIQSAARLVVKLQRPDGGWTSFTPTEEEESLTIEAFFAIPFLIRANASEYSDAIRRGINWLVDIENPAGGWGFYRGDNSHVLTTSYAVRVLAEWKKIEESVVIRDTLNRGLSWLIEHQNPDGSWSQIPNKPGSAVQTAVALLGLTATGLFRPYSKPVVQGRSWLLKNLDNRDGVVDNYIVPKRDARGEIIGFHRRISHVSFPEGILLQALLTSGTDLTDKRLIRLVRGLLDAQNEDGSWGSEFVAYEKPIFAALDAAIALRYFTLQVKESERTLDIKENIMTITKRIDAIQVEQETIRVSLEDAGERLERIVDKLSAIEKSLELEEERMQELLEFYNGLFWLRPLAFVGSWVRKYPLMAVLVIIVLVYIALRIFLAVNSPIVDVGLAIISAALVGIELWQYYRSKKE